MSLPTDHDESERDGPDGDLDRAYARASLADGSRPSPSTRAGILANAQREAAARAAERLTRTGAAANESLWSWRAAAGFAGITFAGVMALWLYHVDPQPTPASTAATELRDSPPPPSATATGPRAGSGADSNAETIAEPPQDITVRGSRVTPRAAPAPRLRKAEPVQRQAQSAAPAQSAALAQRERPDVLQEAVTTAEAQPGAADAAAPPVPMAASAAAPAADSPAGAPAAPAELRREALANSSGMALQAAPAPRAAPSPTRLLQRWFPQALDSDATGLQYWFELDRNGAVTRSGQRAWNDLGELQRWLASDATAPRIVRMQSEHVTNRRGRDVELAYAWLQQ